MLLSGQDELLRAIGLERHRLLMRQPATNDAEDWAVTDVAIGHGAGTDFFDHHATRSVIEDRNT